MTELIASPPCGYVELLVCLQSDDITDDVYDDDLVAPAVRYYFNVSSQWRREEIRFFAIASRWPAAWWTMRDSTLCFLCCTTSRRSNERSYSALQDF